MLKQPIMTKVYNVTDYGVSKQLQSKMEILDFENGSSLRQLEENSEENEIFESLKSSLNSKGKLYIVEGKNGNVLLTNKDLMRIAEIINNYIFLAFPSLKTIYDYFIEIVEILSHFNLPL
jgi:hypothetical protein